MNWLRAIAAAATKQPLLTGVGVIAAAAAKAALAVWRPAVVTGIPLWVWWLLTLAGVTAAAYGVGRWHEDRIRRARAGRTLAVHYTYGGVTWVGTLTRGGPRASGNGERQCFHHRLPQVHSLRDGGDPARQRRRPAGDARVVVPGCGTEMGRSDRVTAIQDEVRRLADAALR